MTTAEVAVGSSGRAAADRKLARILHHMVKHRVPYDASVFAQEEELPTKDANAPSANKPPSTAPTHSAAQC